VRIGQNPARIDTPAYQPQTIGVASLVYIPHLQGYFQQALEVLKLHLVSLRVNSELPFDLLVFDNGSCSEVRHYLQTMQAEGHIRWLITSEVNLGKTGAMNWIFAAMPNAIIGYSDSDVFFRKGWLRASLEVLESFPRAGLVSAQPCFFDILRGEGKAMSNPGPEYRIEEYYPESWIVEEYCRGINAPEALRKRYLDSPLKAIRPANETAQMAILGGSHMQFLARREVLQQVLPLPATRGLAPEEDRVFNQRIDRLGYWQLSTPHPWVVHLGNAIDPAIQPEISALGEAMDRSLQSSPALSAQVGSPLRRLLGKLAKSPALKRYFIQLYNALFEIYSER
jgi:hypothetical protein